MKAATKAGKVRRKRGRPKLEIVYREANGRASRAKEPADKLALENRARRLGLSLMDAKDQRAENFIGYLAILGKEDGLSDVQYRALVLYLEARGDYLRALKAPDATIYNGLAGRAGDKISEGYIAWCKRAVEIHDGARQAIYAAQNENRTANLWAALDLCIIRGEHHHRMIGDVRTLGNVMVRHWQFARPHDS